MLLKRQRGVAVITALLLTTLSVSIVASLFWQQQVQVRSMENQRLHLQTKWILRGALDWARLVLRQDGVDNQLATTLNAVWNTPLAETRLDQYIERERVEGEVFDATLSGRVIDATSRYNLRNLSDGQVVDPKHVQIYGTLLSNLKLDPVLARRTAELVANSQPPPPRALGSKQPAQVRTTAPVEIRRIEDLLAIPGYTPEAVERLREFVIVLPAGTKINVNTAPAEVISALVERYTVSDALGLVARRKQASYRDIANFTEQLRGNELIDTESVDVKSEYFLVQSKIRLDRANLDAEALVERKLGSGSAPTVLSIRQN
ncbi:MAG: type II secretion system minor pseudopilin GspK [Telluria sp.]